MAYHPIRYLRNGFAGLVLLMGGMGALQAEPMKIGPTTVSNPASVFPAPVGEPTPTQNAVRREQAVLTPATAGDVPAASVTPVARPAAAASEPTQATTFEPIMVAPAPAAAATPPVASPAGRLNVVVLGDSLGDGLWAGVYHVFMKDKGFNVIRKSRVATGLVRADYYDWAKAVREIVATTRVDIAVVVMGTNDRQVLVEGAARHTLFDAEWQRVYKARVDDFTRVLSDAGARVYWLELPVMRSPRFEADMRQFNVIFSERAAANQIHFVPTRDLALGPDGGYSAYGADRFGKTKLLRAEDGIHFSLPGYELLGARVAEAIRRDLNGEAPLMVRAKEPVAMPVQTSENLRPQTEPDAKTAEATIRYDVANIRPGRSDDWRWHGDVQ